MKIEKVKIGGFGSFNRGIEIDLSEHQLSLIIGRNEAGKSTIMSSIFGVLFGFKDKAVQQKFEPWDEHDEYAGEVVLLTEDGRRMVIKRQFTDNTAEIGEIAADGTYTAEFLGSANPRGHSDDDIRYYELLESIVGFQDEAIFRSTVFVGQSALEVSVTDQIRKLVSGSGSTDFKGVLHDLHSRFSDLTMENPWRTKNKSKPRELELLANRVDEETRLLEDARKNFMVTMQLEQEVKKLESSQGTKKSELTDTETTLKHFERFCKLLRDRESARERFDDADRRRKTYLGLKEEVVGFDKELKKLKAFEQVGGEFPELVTQLKSETREFERSEALLNKERDLLRYLQPKPNNQMGIVLAIVGALIGGGIMQIGGALAAGAAAIPILAIALFFVGRKLATGYAERKAELEESVEVKTRNSRERQAQIQELLKASHGTLHDEEDPDAVLANYRRFVTLKDEKAQKVSAMRVLGDWQEIDATFDRTAEENLRCNGLMEMILSDAPYLREISEDQVAIANSMEELKRRITELGEEIEVTQEVLTDAKVQLARATADTDYDLPALEDSVNNGRRELKRTELERDALRLVIDTLEECVTEFQEGDLTKLSEEVSGLFRDITNNRYTRVTLSPNMEPMLTKYDNTHIQVGDLSQGTQDQLYFAMRVAIARHLSKNVALPLFLDDPFVNFDQERLDVTQSMLEKLGDHQVVLTTCNREYESWSKHVMDLDASRAEALASDGALRLRPAS